MEDVAFAFGTSTSCAATQDLTQPAVYYIEAGHQNQQIQGQEPTWRECSAIHQSNQNKSHLWTETEVKIIQVCVTHLHPTTHVDWALTSGHELTVICLDQPDTNSLLNRNRTSKPANTMARINFERAKCNTNSCGTTKCDGKTNRKEGHNPNPSEDEETETRRHRFQHKGKEK